MNVTAIIQARMGSERLPGKVLLDLGGEPMLARVFERAKAVPHIHRVAVATSTLPQDDRLVGFCRERGWDCFRGSEVDVLDRYYQAALAFGADHVVRVTADCPLLCFEQADRVVAEHLAQAADYSHNITVLSSGMPLGTGTEIFTLAALRTSWEKGHEPHHREHVDEYIEEHPEEFKIVSVDAPEALRRPHYRLTVDTPADLELMRRLQRLPHPPGTLLRLADVVAHLDRHPDLLELNRHIVQKTA